MLCKAPVIAPDIGAQPEIVTHGDNGFLVSDLREVVESIKNIDSLKMSPEIYEQLKEKYALKNVVNSYIPLYEQVSQGLRW